MVVVRRSSTFSKRAPSPAAAAVVRRIYRGCFPSAGSGTIGEADSGTSAKSIDCNGEGLVK